VWLKKGWTRRRYVRLLLRNMKRTLEHFGVEYDEFVRLHGRILVRSKSAVEAASRLANVFGVSSVSPAFETSSGLENVVEKSVFLADGALGNGSSFAVECTRVGRHPYSSGDVCREVGSRVLEAFGEERTLRVDLGAPDVRLGVEVREDSAYVYTEVVDGVGGFPLGSQGRVIGLLSGGVDSAVASWLVMKRGAIVRMIYFDISPYISDAAIARVGAVGKVLADWAVGFARHLHIVPYGDALKAIVMECPQRLTCVLCKRMMYRIAERLAERMRAKGIATGDALGEQASQTLHNLMILSSAVSKYPIHRPVFGFDKAETERLARRIGVYEPSIGRAGVCRAVPKKPATKAKLEDVLAAEAELDIDGLIEMSVKELKILKL
jgi:thiamine biosynthesis protein ThiI